jgi:hypothetical protein
MEGGVTDEEFLANFSGGLDLQGQRVTARIGKLAAHLAVGAAVDSGATRHFLIQINYGEEIPVTFEKGAGYAQRMAQIDAAVERWLLLRGRQAPS